MRKAIVFIFFYACCVPLVWGQEGSRASACDTPSGDFTYQINDATVTFSNSVVAATSWKWDFGDGATSTSKEPIHKYAAYGKFNVCLTAFGSCSQALFCTTIELKLVTAVEDIPDHTQVHPNPVNDQLFISFEGALPQHVRIISVEGKSMLSLGPDEVRSSMQCDLSKLHSGVYFLVWSVGDHSEVRRIVKVK